MRPERGGTPEVPHWGIKGILWSCQLGGFVPYIPASPPIVWFLSLRFFMTRRILFVSMAVLGAASPVVAQNPLQNGRSVVASPAVLGMGDAAAAFPTNGSSFFYNPAHVVRTTGFFPRFQLGLQGRGSNNLRNYYDFVKDDLEPAIDEGIANLTEDEIDTLRARALAATQERGYAMAEVPAAFAMRIGPVAFGIGGFVHAEGRLRALPSSGDLPIVEASVLRDVSAIGTAAVDASLFGMNGLAMGVNARVTRRALAIKEKDLDTWGDDEQLYLHEATAVGVDIGVLYDLPVPLPGKLTAGAAFYDVVGGTFDYAYKDRYVCGSLRLSCNYSGGGRLVASTFGGGCGSLETTHLQGHPRRKHRPQLRPL